jgi:hypothetical protein
MTYSSRPGIVLGFSVLILTGPSSGTADERTPRGRWSPAPSMATPRINHTATLLQDGRVLVSGGTDSKGTALSSCEVYDPSSARWSRAAALQEARSGHSALLLPDGRVAVLGGLALVDGSGQALTGVELYDPARDTWSRRPPLAAPAAGPSTLLLDGRVLLFSATGESFEGYAEPQLYDALSANRGPLPRGRPLAAPASARLGQSHSTTRLPDGRVLVAGGMAGDEFAQAQSAALLFLPPSGTWQRTADLVSPRSLHTATLLSDGRVVVAAGWGVAEILDSVEVFDPAALAWRAAGRLLRSRFGHTATLLGDRVLLVGGQGEGHRAVPEAELYDAATARSVPAGTLARPRWGHTATLLPGPAVLVVGGYDGAPMAATEVFRP